MTAKQLIKQLEKFASELENINKAYIIRKGKEVVCLKGKELIDELQKLDPQKEVSLEMSAMKDGREVVIEPKKIKSIPQKVEINIVIMD